VRELENVIERAVTLSTSPVISAEEFRTILNLGNTPGRPPVPTASRTVQGAERETIVRALNEANGNQTRAAETLGMARNTLWRKMKKYGLDGKTGGPTAE
jgi:DNA-binding NtrC family response regulator